MDPFPTLDVMNNNYTTLLDIGKDDPFKNEYCCFVGVNGDLVRIIPQKPPQSPGNTRRRYLGWTKPTASGAN